MTADNTESGTTIRWLGTPGSSRLTQIQLTKELNSRRVHVDDKTGQITVKSVHHKLNGTKYRFAVYRDGDKALFYSAWAQLIVGSKSRHVIVISIIQNLIQSQNASLTLLVLQKHLGWNWHPTT